MVLEETSLKVLSDSNRKRGVIKAALTRMSNFVKGFDPKVKAISLLEFRRFLKRKIVLTYTLNR